MKAEHEIAGVGKTGKRSIYSSRENSMHRIRTWRFMVPSGESSFLCLQQRFLEAGQEELGDAEKEGKICAADQL